jgi:hypothetical protein
MAARNAHITTASVVRESVVESVTTVRGVVAMAVSARFSGN